MDLSDDGQQLDPEWVELGNNVCGVLRGCRDASAVAQYFVRAGWSSRSSSWRGYEVETSWCQLEVDLVEGPDVLLNGVVDPQRVDELAGILHRFGMSYSLELYEGDNTLVREIQA
ncbi:hypothetical protein [Streptomyces sp. NBC_00829]|uniref:hypothetical protein n=1 Tax=Streptomyces sp. NBC_00829 TaxID=2903679 RepID=UPI0038706F49|nr:hypothetical protein OG293_10265 [Streptomyces sp. NBC_00829]